MPHELLLAKGFTLLTPLGKGAYGQVWHALDPKGANVAVKVFHDSTAQAKAKDEAGALAAFDNAHLLRLHLLLEDSLQRQLYLVTEFAAGGDLLKLMQERECKPLLEEDIRRYFRQLLFALDHMHRRGWVHRDVKCENILLSEKRDHIILADFGFATQWSPTRYLTEPLGSLHYSAPEICAGEPYRGPEVDVWSMGVVLYALCTGRLPFGGSTEQEIADRIMAGVCPTPRTVSGPLRSVINALLTPDISKRATLDQLKLHPWICGAGNKPNSVMPRVITDLHAPIAPLPAVRRPQERRGSMIGPRPTVPPTELPPTRPRHNSVVQIDEAVRAIAENQANIEAEVELESTADASAVIEAGALLTVETRDEDGFFARLSRFTKSGVKRFHLSRLGKGNKKDAKAEAQTHAHAAPPAASAPGLSPEKNRVAH